MKEESTMYTTTEVKFQDEGAIHINAYKPVINNGTVVIIAPSPSHSKEFYHPLADFLAGKGYPVFTFDYRGMGIALTSKERRGCQTGLHEWAVQDTDAVILHARNKYPGHELIFIGHCIGGEIIGLSRASQYINKLVLISSALSCWKLWPVKDKLRIIGLKFIIRALSRIYGFYPGKKIGVMGNIPKQVVKEWANWCDKPNGLFDSFPDNHYHKLRIPILAFSFADDWHTPPKAVKELLNRFTFSEQTWHHLSPKEIGQKKVLHDGFFDPVMKKTLWPAMAHWINTSGITTKKNRSWVVGYK